MINMVADPDNRVRDHGSEFFIVFIPQLFKWFLLAVRSVDRRLRNATDRINTAFFVTKLK